MVEIGNPSQQQPPINGIVWVRKMSLSVGLQTSKRHHRLVPDQVIEAEVSQPLNPIPLIVFKGFDTLHNLEDFRGSIKNNEQDTYFRRTFIGTPLNPQFWCREARASDGMAASMAIEA